MTMASSSGRRTSSRTSASVGKGGWVDWREVVAFWTLVALLVAATLLGGSSREDMVQLLALRPIGVIALAIGLFCLDRATVTRHFGLLSFALAVVLLIAMQLVPLPPAIWQVLPGRELLAEAANLTGQENRWQPISLVPWRTWNSLHALAVPAAALVLVCQLSDAQRQRLVPIILGLAAAGLLLALMQLLAPGNGGLRLYRIRSEAVPIGWFANRNHQAVYLAAMLLLTFAWVEHMMGGKASRQVRRLMATMAALLIVIFVVASGSRMGFGALGAALLLLAWIAARPQRHSPAANWREWLLHHWLEAGAALIAAGIAALFFFSRSTLLERLASQTEGEELRFKIWGPIAEMTASYFPVGAGFGTFPEVFKIGEPVGLIKDSYVNHAHNDWLEPLLEGGAFAAALMLIAAVALVRRAAALARQPREGWIMARTGLAMIGLMLLGSASDYPLRTPLLACLFVIACVWTITPDQLTPSRRNRRR